MSHAYYLVKRVSTRRGISPQLPRGVGFLELADPGIASPWALYRCDWRRRLGRFMREVPDELGTLIRSGERYPPALAFARNDISRLGRRRRRMTRAEFVRSYAASLRRHLRSQRSTRHVLAESRVDDSGYR